MKEGCLHLMANACHGRRLVHETLETIIEISIYAISVWERIIKNKTTEAALEKMRA